MLYREVMRAEKELNGMDCEGLLRSAHHFFGSENSTTTCTPAERVFGDRHMEFTERVMGSLRHCEERSFSLTVARRDTSHTRVAHAVY